MLTGKLKCQRNDKGRFSWLCRLLLMGGWLIAFNACTSGEEVPETASSPDSDVVVSATAVSVNTPIPTLTPTPTITATPAATPTAPPYIIEPEGQYENWSKYTNLTYGFTFSFPADWKVFTSDHFVEVRQDEQVLLIGIKGADEDAQIARTGIGYREVLAQGTVNFLGQDLAKSVIGHNNQAKQVLYFVFESPDGLHINVEGRVFTLEVNVDDDPSLVLSPIVQEIADKIVESFALVEPASISESQDADLADLPTPQPGWAWYYNELHDFAVTYPETWRQSGAAFDAPETNSQVQVRPHDLPAGEDWLDWVRGNQADLIFTDPVTSDVIEANATVDGQPAYFRLAESGGISQILLAFPEGDQVVTFYFHSGTLPRVEEEMLVFRTMIENFVWHGRSNSQTTLPQGWETGGSLEIFLPAVTPAELADEAFQPFRDGIMGTVTKWDWPEFVLTTDEEETYNIQLSSGYDFQGLPVQGFNLSETETIAEGDRILVTGYPLADDDSIRPNTIAVERAGNWQPAYYQAFFDLTRQKLEPDLLSLYPQGEDFVIGLRGSVTQVVPLLVDEAGNPLTAEALALGLNQKVLARGTLQSTDPFRITLTELFVLEGECVVVSEQEENCFFWQPIFP